MLKAVHLKLHSVNEYSYLQKSVRNLKILTSQFLFHRFFSFSNSRIVSNNHLSEWFQIWSISSFNRRMCLKIVRFWKNLQLHHVVSKMFSLLIESQRNRIVHHLRIDELLKSIANLKDVIRRVMKKIRSNLKTFNISTFFSMRKFDRSRSVTSSMKIALKHCLKTKSWSYLKKMMKYLFDEFDVFVNTTFISRILKRLKISRKVMKKKTMKRSQTCKNAYVLKISEYINDMLMFLDENAANEQIMNRQHE